MPARIQRPSRWSLYLTIIVAILPTAIVMYPTAILLGVGLLPTWVAFAVDRDPEKPCGLCVGALNICGVLPYCLLLWHGEHSMAHVMSLASKSINWIAAYGAAAFGWIIYLVVPPAVTPMLVRIRRDKIQQLRGKQAFLVREWGEAVTGMTSGAGDEKDEAASGRPAR